MQREREEACPDGFHEEELAGAGGGDEGARLGGVGGEGFFAEDGLVGEEAEHGVLVVVGVWEVCAESADSSWS